MKWLTQLFQGDQTASQAADEIKSRAYLAYNESGPDGSKHRDSKLADVFPDAPEATRLAWIAEFKKIDNQIWDVVNRGIAENQHRQFSAQMRNKFPFMNRQALDRAWDLAGYYAMHG